MKPDADELEAKRQQVDDIRRVERGLHLSSFRRGQLAGAQQALWWATGRGLEPIAAFLTTQQEAEAAALIQGDANVPRPADPSRHQAP